MISSIFNFATNLVSITGNFWVDLIWVGLIGAISFAAGWNITGAISDDLGHSSILMSIAHWTIRIVVFAALVYFSKGIYSLTQL